MRSGTISHVIVSVGGVDPGAGAGIGRDLLTLTALGAAVRMVGTAWTEQNAGGVLSVEPRAPAALEDALRWALRPPVPGAVKVGMVPGPEHAAAVVRGLARFDGPIVADPVLAASSGGALWQGPLDAVLDLLRRATLATPNATEAALLAARPVTTAAEAAAAALDLHRAGVPAVLIKGGHLGSVTDGGASITDVLVTAHGERRYTRPRVPGRSPRGTGCALSSAIAVELAGGRGLEDAIERATDWLAQQIAGAIEIDGERRLP
ncbi:MAG TPA: hydroxymethylpyrimidine/phosphomethylpyrimidine kinase [Polyangia bacterium]|nr:hydroxymethylpyrimidine/phosphomethylpyrimidine kinase [Polyangia bacterium]